MIYQIGTNKKTVEFLQRLQGDPDILPVTNVIPHHKCMPRVRFRGSNSMPTNILKIV